MSVTSKSKTQFVILCDICNREVVSEDNPLYTGIAKKAKHFCALHAREEGLWATMVDLGLKSTETAFWKEVKQA